MRYAPLPNTLLSIIANQTESSPGPLSDLERNIDFKGKTIKIKEQNKNVNHRLFFWCLAVRDQNDQIWPVTGPPEQLCVSDDCELFLPVCASKSPHHF